MDQAGLDSWSNSTEESRPAAEAEAVAGDDETDPQAIVNPQQESLPDADGEVEIGVTQVDYTVEGYDDDEEPIVHVFGRTADGAVEHVRVVGFRPYFYAPTDSFTEADLADDRITDTAAGFESIRGEELTRIYGRTPRDVGDIREDFEHYEADILFPNRFLIDAGIQSGMRVPERRDDADANADDSEADDGPITVTPDEVEPVDMSADLRVNTFDIEVDDRQGFPEEGEEPIICLASHDSYDDEYVLWLQTDNPGDGVPPVDLDGYDPMQEGTAVEVRTYDTEQAMLDAFLTYIEETDPDVLTGWNFEDFDAPYLLDRLERLDDGEVELRNPTAEARDRDFDLDIDRLSRVDEVWRSNWGGPTIKGRVVFDLLYAYKRTQFTELESYRLDAVAEQELGVGKERYTGDIGDLWEDDPERLLEYNLRDVELCVELDRKQDIIPFWEEVASFVGCKLEDATTPGDAVDMYVLQKLNGEYALPSKGHQEGEDYEGGAVFDPITGVRENVTVLDLKSLYPMCMVTINASPETTVDPEEYDGETYRAPNSQHFRKEPDGVIREMVDELLSEREEKKEHRDEFDPKSDEYDRFDRQQASVKVIMNSLYGVLGWDRFRLYDREMGAAVTATGRAVIEYTETAAAEIGHEVVYGDSVTGDRPIVVRDPEGVVRIRPISSLFDRGSRASTHEVMITTDGGAPTTVSTGKESARLDGWEALSLSDDGTAEWRAIEQVIRHETEKSVVKLQHKFGESTTTRDHSFVVEDDGQYVEANPSAVEEPLRIPGVPAVDPVETIDVYEVLEGYTREYDDGRSVGSEAAQTKVKRVHANEEYVWFGHENHGELESTIKVQRYIDIDSEDGLALLRLLAAYVTEGSATTAETAARKFGASISESREEWLEGLKADYERLFENATVSVIASDTADERTLEYETQDGAVSLCYDDQTRKLQLMNEVSAVFFREFAGQGSRGKRIPGFVFNLDEEHRRLFLDVLVEGDGSREFPRYSDDYCERNFDFETTSRELTGGLSMLLTQLGEKHSLKYREEKGSYTIRTCDSYRDGRDPVLTDVDHDGYVYDLSVAENDNFVDAIGGIVLHNTDSVMLELGGGIETDAAIESSFDLEDHINESYDAFASDELNAESHRFQIEFEKLYRRFFQAGKKKRYAGHIVWKEGKDIDDIDITGFEYQRSDIAPITKRVQKQVIEMIVTGESIEDVKYYVAEVIEDYEAGNVNLDDVGIPGGIGKRLDDYDTDTAQVRGAKYANLLLGTNFQRGSKPKRLYVDRVHDEYFQRVERERGIDPAENHRYREFKRDVSDGDGVICFEYADQVPEEFEIDWGKMLEKTLRGPIARILEALDVSWEEVRTGQEQSGLESFM